MMGYTYSVDGHRLVRFTVPRRGKPYTHCCSREVLSEVADRIDQGPITTDILWAELKFPRTQISVALHFLKERGCVRTLRGRRTAAPENGGVFEDAMIEFYALAEKGGTI